MVFKPTITTHHKEDIMDIDKIQEITGAINAEKEKNPALEFEDKVLMIREAFDYVFERIDSVFNEYTDNADPETLMEFDGVDLVPLAIQEEMMKTAMVFLGAVDAFAQVIQEDKALLTDTVANIIVEFAMKIEKAVRLCVPRKEFLNFRKGIMAEDFIDGRPWSEHLAEKGVFIDPELTEV
jgi:hypothetical protein